MNMLSRKIGNLSGMISFIPQQNQICSRSLASAAEFSVKNNPSSDIDPRGSLRRIPVYGIHPVELCLKANRRRLYTLYVGNRFKEHPRVEKIVRMAESLEVPVKEVNKFKLQMMCEYLQSNQRAGKIMHQGVVLHTSRLPLPLWNNDMSIFGKTDSQQKLAVFLDKVQDPMNMGAVIRSCVFLGVDLIFIPSEGSCHLSPVVSKASSGAMELANIYLVPKTDTFFGFLKSLNWDILGTTEECQPYSKFPPSRVNRLIVLGNEGHGVNDDLRRFFTTTVSIPSSCPSIDSLNVSVAAGVLLSHFRKSVQPL